YTFKITISHIIGILLKGGLSVKKVFSLLLALLMVLSLAACGGNTPAEPSGSGDSGSDKFKIAIVTGTVSQSEDDRRGAEAIQAKYGEDVVVLATYPDNFTEEYETTVQTIVNFADDPEVKAIVVNQGVPGTTEAFQKVKEMRPDMICLVGEAHEDLPVIGSVADVVVNNDFVARGYLMIKTAHDLGCDTFVHVSFPRHLSYETMSRRVAIMRAACEELGLTFVMETAPDPTDTSAGGMDGAVAFMKENTPKWIEKYGQNAAFFCTNDGETAPMLAALLENGGYFIEADLPSPLMGYPEALGGLDTTAEAGDFAKITKKVEDAVVAAGGAGRFGTWTCSWGYSLSAGLGQYAYNVLSGTAKLQDAADLSAALKEFSGVDWNGSNYVDATTGVKSDSIVLLYQDTYIFGKGYMGVTDVEVPEKYFNIAGE
ncbi:MAG: DUF3798 domain-containing protein, partial [Erysipelotrichaceae bacterium]|nr:DUF3798 domain-containing protein [Erysipelotrichaceae bacterium]